MATPLADLDELILSCRNDTSKSLIREAVLCYKSGAFRSAIISTWIAVAFDLVEKIRELALAGDKEADLQVNHFENIQKELDLKKCLEFERDLLKICRDKFELFTSFEHQDLDRLLEDRNRCAHPNLVRMGEAFAPPAELVRCHLRVAIEHVLQHPPRSGKAALDELYKEIQSEYFPSSEEGAFRVLNDGPLARAKENLIRGFVLGITARLLSGELTRRESVNRLFAIRAVNRMHPNYFPNIYNPHLAKVFQKTKDGGLLYLISILRWLPGSISAVSDGLAERIRTFLFLAQGYDRAVAVVSGLRVPKFYAEALARLETMDLDELAEIISIRPFAIPDVIIGKFLKEYETAGSFASANKIGDKLILPTLSHFSRERLTELFDLGSKNDQIQGSVTFDKILREIRSGDKFTELEFGKEMEKRGWQTLDGGNLSDGGA